MSELLLNHFTASLTFAIPVFLVCLALVVCAQRWKVTWEAEKDRYSVMRIRTHTESTGLYEMVQTNAWSQAFVDKSSIRGKYEMNPLAVKKNMADMMRNQMNEVRETVRKNDEMINQLKAQYRSIQVRRAMGR